MKRGTGMFAAIISLSLLLSSIACTAAAAVTHGDLLMLAYAPTASVQVSTTYKRRSKSSGIIRGNATPTQYSNDRSTCLCWCCWLLNMPPACACMPGVPASIK